MSQPRRSQRLAGRRVEPVPILGILIQTALYQLVFVVRCAVQRIRALSMSRVAILLPIDNVSLMMQKFRAPIAAWISSQCLTLSPVRVPIGHVDEILGIVWSARKL